MNLNPTPKTSLTTPKEEKQQIRAPKQTPWQPIETAPKEEIEVFAWSKKHGFNVGILYPYKKPEMLSRKGGGFQPSIWMPIPPLPNKDTLVATPISSAKPVYSKKPEVAAIELLDGAYDIIETWKVESPAQIAWKQAWLAKAKELGVNPSWC